MPNTAKLALNGNACGVMWARLERVEWRTALRVGVMMIIVEVASAVVEPAGGRINEPGRIQLLGAAGQVEFRIVPIGDLTPPFIVDDLEVT